jgi:hypothetical protein
MEKHSTEVNSRNPCMWLPANLAYTTTNIQPATPHPREPFIELMTWLTSHP